MRPWTPAEARFFAEQNADGNRIICDREGCMLDDGTGFEVFAHRPASSLRPSHRGLLICPVPTVEASHG